MESRERSPNAKESLNKEQLIESLKTKPLFDAKEVCALLDITEPTLRRAIKAGKIKTIYIGRFYRIPSKEIERYLQDDQKLLTVQEAAKLLSVSAITIRSLIKSEKIRAFRLVGKGRFKIAKSEIERITTEGT